MGILSWRGIAAGILLMVGLVAGTLPSKADPPPAKARIGDITFNYTPFQWRIEPNGTGLTATCVPVDCRGVVFDFSVRDGYGECGKDAVRETAARLFPMADRHAVNAFRSGRFGLVLAESRHGAALGVAEYVFACLDWQDREYRFAMRPETVGDSTWAGGALAYLVSRANTPPALVGVLKLRGLELPYPTEIWRPTEMAPGQSYWLACLPPTCRGEGEFVTVSAEPTEIGCTFDKVDGDLWNYSEPEVIPLTPSEPNGLAFSVGTTHSPCRNYVPPHRVACAWHDGIAYRITAPGGFGCKSGFDIPDDALENLVSGARLVPAQ